MFLHARFFVSLFVCAMVFDTYKIQVSAVWSKPDPMIIIILRLCFTEGSLVLSWLTATAARSSSCRNARVQALCKFLNFSANSTISH